MSWLGALGAVGGAIGGGARGAAGAYPTIMESAARRASLAQDQNQFDAQQADLAQYRADTLAQDQSQFNQTFAETQTNNRWERALNRRELHIRRINAERDRIREENDNIRLTMASRRDGPTQEAYEARLKRAENVLSRATIDMSDEERDHLARLNLFENFAQAQAVAGRQAWAPAPPPPPLLSRQPMPAQTPGWNPDLAGIPRRSAGGGSALSDEDAMFLETMARLRSEQP